MAERRAKSSGERQLQTIDPQMKAA